MHALGDKKHSLVVGVLALLAFCLILAAVWFTQFRRTPATHPPREGRLVVAFSTTHDDHVDFYQNGNQVCYDTYSSNPKDRPEFLCFEYLGNTLTADDIYFTWTNKHWENVDQDDPGVVGADWDIWGEVTPGTRQIINGGHVSFIDINAPTPEPLDPK